MHHSLLFVPADRPERFDRAVASSAGAAVIDLEDAVQPEAKDAARANIADWLGQGGKAVVRINAIGTQWHKDDIALLSSAGILAVMLPMVEDAATLRDFIAALPAPLPVIALIETARGLWDLEDIVAV
ncbi:MAG: CoA ester lyase, partial [Rhodobacteraceae bacterium]|nr:CoA ester lyase [Paracoccaceae bacterium]